MYLFVTYSLIKIPIHHCLRALAKWIGCCWFKFLSFTFMKTLAIGSMAHKLVSTKYLVGHFLIHICKSRIRTWDYQKQKSNRTPGLALENKTKVNFKGPKEEWLRTTHLFFLLLVEYVHKDPTSGPLVSAWEGLCLNANTDHHIIPWVEFPSVFRGQQLTAILQ